MQIRDGAGNGYLAKVDKDQKLTVYSTSASQQHVVSESAQQAYQVIGTVTPLSGTAPILHIKNTSSTKSIVVTYIRHQVLDPSGGTALPNASCYFKVALGRTYSSGGTEVTPVNVFAGSGNTADVTAYSGASAITLAGTASEIDRWYTKAEGDMSSFNKEGALIIPPSQTIECSYVSDHTSGTVYTRVSFLMEEH
jgi:hypothetical protein